MTVRSCLAAFALFLLVCTAPAPAHGQDKEWDIARYDVDLTVDTTGTYAITESITFDLQRGTFTQGERRIPMRLVDTIEQVSVTSADVAITDVSTETRSRETVIQWQYPERDTATTFTLSYVATGAPYTLSGQTVIDWQAMGDGWNVPVRAMQATVQLPFPEVPRDSIRLEPAADATLDSTATGWQAAFAYNDLAGNEGYRLRIRLPEVIDAPQFEEAAAANSGPALPQVIAGVLLALAGLGGGGVWAWNAGGTPTRASSGYRKPSMPLEEAGYLLLRQVGHGGMRVISAMVFDLAQRGHLTLRHVPKEASWSDSSTSETRVTVHRNDDDRLSEREETLLQKLAAYNTMQAFYKEEAAFRSEQMQELRTALTARGWLETHPARAWGGGVGGLMLMGGGLAALILASGWVAAIGIGLGIGGGCGAWLVAAQYRTLTAEGATHHADAEAYRTHLREQVEATIETNPAAAAHQFIEALPWMGLDPKVNGAWLDTLNEALDEHPEDIALPTWVENAVEPDEDDVVTSFLPLYLMYVSVLPSSAAGSSMGGVSSVSVGAGAVGGAGGGGGGVS